MNFAHDEEEQVDVAHVIIPNRSSDRIDLLKCRVQQVTWYEKSPVQTFTGTGLIHDWTEKNTGKTGKIYEAPQRLWF